MPSSPSTCWIARARPWCPPFEISVFADPAGSFTTAAAMVAKVEKALAQKQGDLAGRKVVIFGGTGVVGFAAAVITALPEGHARARRL